MRRTYRIATVLLIICVMLAAGSLFPAAKDDPGIEVYNTELVTNDLDATYIEGEIPVADGQDIVVMHGILSIAKKTMPETGQPAKFRIKIPATEINKDKTTSIRVRATAGKTVPESLPVRAEITYKSKEEQTIKTGSEKYKLTLPGLRESIKAKASSGSDVYYVSSDPKVVDVDEDGNLIPTGKGKAKVSIKTIGSNKFKGVEKSIDVSVEKIDGYMVAFHSSIDGQEDQVEEQIIRTGTSEPLLANTFENGDHQFLGWATEDGGMVEYLDSETVSELAQDGETTDLYAVWTGDGINAAIAWAVMIANDDSFAYGKTPETSRVGCYFCGTTHRNKPKGYEKTYVCMPFVTAAYAHGAEDPEMLAIDQEGKRCLSTDNSNFQYSCWSKVGLCSNLSVSDLQPGDVICTYAADNKSGHLAMYIGNGDIVDAGMSGWGPNTIAVRPGTAGRYLSGAARKSGQSYVMRYVGPNQ